MGDVGMAVKSIQTRVVGIIRYMLHPYCYGISVKSSMYLIIPTILQSLEESMVDRLVHCTMDHPQCHAQFVIAK